MRFILLFLVFLISSVFAKNVYISVEKSTNEIIVNLHNKNHFDITFKYAPKYTNLYPLDNLPLSGTLKAKSKRVVGKFMVGVGKYSLNHKYKWVVGNKNVLHNDKYLYALPYKKGTFKFVTQGFNGVFSHKGDSQYAVDFNLKTGDRVYASRDGLVVMTKADGKKGGALKKFYSEANFITIKHDDGTYGKYNHLAHNGVKVKVGQKIKRGQFIGISGNTGYTNGEHLHFIVYKPKDYKSRESIKIKFIAREGIVIYPKRGMKLTAK